MGILQGYGVANLDRQNRAPSVTRTPDFRNHVERKYDVLNWIPKTPASVLAECWLPLGTTDEEFTDCYLVGQIIEGQMGDFYEPCKYPPILIRTFEQLNGLNETQIGQAGVIMDQYGNRSVIFDYYQLAAGTSIYQVPGTTAAPTPFTDCILKTEERTNNGTLIQIKRTYINAGELSDNEQLKFGGRLLIRELTYLNQVPPTPSGWTLITKSIEFIQGLPVYKYGFVDGNTALGQGGVISNEVNYDMSPDQGATGITVTTIQYITDASISSNPITGPGGSELISIKYTDEDGYRLWTGIYASGMGVVASSVDTKEGGKLIVYSKTAINAVPSTPAATIGGTVVLVQANQRNGTRIEDGTIVYEYQWAEGNGLVSENISSRTDGLREVTDISLGTRIAPSGVVIRDDVRQADGYPIYTVTAMQSDSGGAVTAVSLTIPKVVQFTYPGRAKAYDVTFFTGYHALDVFLSPPIETVIVGQVDITYQASNSIGSIGTLWQPVEWATIEAFWVQGVALPKSHIEALRGYRSVDDTPLSITYGSLSTNNGTMLGQPAYGGTDGQLTCFGGPPAPDGNTYTLEASLELAFVSTTGTQYYRKTVVSATIPSQPALPV